MFVAALGDLGLIFGSEDLGMVLTFCYQQFWREILVDFTCKSAWLYNAFCHVVSKDGIVLAVPRWYVD